MSKGGFIGVGDTARKVRVIYVGVNGVARKVVKGYIGDEAGVARQFWRGVEVRPAISFEIVIEQSDLTWRYSRMSYTGTTDWGDGTTNPGVLHTYAAAGTYTVKVYGTIRNIAFQNCTRLRRVLTPFSAAAVSGITSFFAVFDGCTGLREIPDDLFAGCVNAVSFGSAFRGCTQLDWIPCGVFAGCTAAREFTNCFQNCSMLSGLPDDLFADCTAATSFNSCFRGCAEMLSLPDGLFDACSQAVEFGYCFMGTARLFTIPAGLFDYCSTAASFGYCFMNSGISAIPTGLFDHCSAAASFRETFRQCQNIYGALPPLWVTHASVPHLMCFQNCGNASNYMDAYNAGWA